MYILLTISMLFWGFSFIWTKIVFEYYKPITIIFFRLIISSAFLWLLNLWLNRIKRIRKKDLRNLLFLTFLEPFLYFIGESYGLTYVSSTVAAVIISTIPLFSPIAGYYFINERITLMNFVGIVISIIGVVLVILKDNLVLNASPQGLALLFLAVVSAIIYSIYLIKLSVRYDVYSIITYQNTFGILFFLPFFFWFDYADFMKVGFHYKPFVSILQLSIFASSVAFLLFSYGVKKLGVTKANAFTNMIPIFTALFSFFILNERLSLINSIGILTVIVGLFVSQLKFNTLQTKN